ncbi:MAG: DUF1501 domain-containing protein, partial [Planctomycetota bacterium]|nr:DUF1501 domain-containing protein [Planctomycetota bacterium]
MTQDRDLPSRRRFLAQGMAGVSLTGLLPRELFADDVRPHHPPRVRRVIQLCMHGGPSSIDLFDEKPTLNERRGQDLPESVRKRLALPMMTRDQGRWPLVGAAHPFVEHGASGIRMSELLPHIGSLADQITLVRSLTTDPLDHAGAISQMSTGHAAPGAPALGSWIAHALESENEVLPGYVVLRSGAGGPALSPRTWGAGSLPSRARARSLRAGGHDAPGVDAETRRAQVDALSELDRLHHAAHGDPHTLDHSAT